LTLDCSETEIVDTNLHPSLARLASTYDNIVEQYSQGLISAIEARKRITELSARDDNGVIWRLDPDTALWQYLTIQNTWKTATPPTSGLVLPTGHDISGNIRSYNPDSRIEFTEEATAAVAEGLDLPDPNPDSKNFRTIQKNYKYILLPLIAILVSYLIYRAFEPVVYDVIAPGERPIDSR
jgi:hypothetical protein